MADKNKKQKIVLSKEAEGSLTATEILHREAEYRNDLGSFKKGLIADERFKKDGIRKLAKDLEAAGTVENNRICARIKSDLAILIENKLLAGSYLEMVLDDKYKRSGGYKSEPKNLDSEAEKEESQEQGDSGIDIGKEESEESETESIPRSPISVKEELEHDESIDDQYHFIRGLTELVTGLKEEELLNSNDNFKLVEETKQYRFKVAKRLDDLNLKTIYGNVRTLMLVLNDYVKQLDNEVGVRQSKGELLQE